MNDNILCTWDVVSSDVGTVMFRCAKKETAEYLRDWLEAVEYNRFLYAKDHLVDRGVSDTTINNLFNGLDDYSICESEVILD